MSHGDAQALWGQDCLRALKRSCANLLATIGQVEQMLRELEAADEQDVAQERGRHRYRDANAQSASH